MQGADHLGFAAVLVADVMRHQTLGNDLIDRQPGAETAIGVLEYDLQFASQRLESSTCQVIDALVLKDNLASAAYQPQQR